MEIPDNQSNVVNKSVTDISPDDEIICTVYQHLFGIIFIYILSVIGILALVILTKLLFPNSIVQGSADYNIFIMSIFIVVLVVALMLVLATWLYRMTKLVVTTKNVVFVMQKSLLFRKITALSLDDVEEVSSTKQGIFATMFNFGTIKIETASEQVDLVFNYCYAPDKVTKIIYDAKEKFLANAKKPLDQ